MRHTVFVNLVRYPDTPGEQSTTAYAGSMPFVQIVVLAGGTGGARFLRGLRAARADADITAVVNTGDDVTMHGLRICPDLDSVDVHPRRRHRPGARLGPGRRELDGQGGAGRLRRRPDWFGLGDRDIATHLVRTRMLDAGYPLSAVTAALCRPLAARRHGAADERPAGGDPRRRGRPGDRPQPGDPLPGVVGAPPRRPRRPRRSSQVGVDAAKPAPGVLEAFAAADVILLAPQNPVVSIGTILGVPGLREALLAAPAPVVGVSPIIGGGAGPRHGRQCLRRPGRRGAARQGVGRLYGARPRRAARRLAGATRRRAPTCPGSTVRACPLWMTDDGATAADGPRRAGRRGE